MSEVVASAAMDGERSAQVRAWFAAQRRRFEARDVAPAPLDFPWTARDLFAEPQAATGGALGVDFVTACKARCVVDVGRCLPTVAGRPPRTSLKLDQRLESGGLGAVVWNCGRALCSFLPRLPELRRGDTVGSFLLAADGARPRVLDLGTGTGVVGLACWLRGADVVLTDLPGALVDLARANARGAAAAPGEDPLLVDLPDSLRVVAHAWGTPTGPLGGAPFDVVVGSDCLYDPKALPALLKTLLAVTDDRSVVYLAYKRRLDDREAPFFEDLARHFATVRFSKPDETPTEWRGTGLSLCRVADRRPDLLSAVVHQIVDPSEE